MDEFLRQDVFWLLLSPTGAVFVLFLVVLSDKQVTRLTVFFWGLVLIALAGYIAYELMRWRITAELLTRPTAPPNLKINSETLAEFDRWSQYVLWLVPFLTGALGTNLISDALTKPLKYKKPFSMLRLGAALVQSGWMFVQLVTVFLLSPLLLLAGIVGGLKHLRTCPRRWRVYGKLYRRAYLHSIPRARPPWLR